MYGFCVAPAKDVIDLEARLKQFFTRCGAVVSADSAQGWRHKPYAVINFSTSEGAANALKLKESEMPAGWKIEKHRKAV